MGISYSIKSLWSATNSCLPTLWQSVAGNSTFRGIVYCYLGTSKTVISKFVTRQIDTPYSSPCIMTTPTMVPWDKNSRGEKKVSHKNVLIPL
jgi:hypothetical protein